MLHINYLMMQNKYSISRVYISTYTHFFKYIICYRLARYERILKPLNIFQTVSGEAYYNALLNNDCRTWSPENHSKLQEIDGLSHILYNGAKLT